MPIKAQPSFTNPKTYEDEVPSIIEAPFKDDGEIKKFNIEAIDGFVLSFLEKEDTTLKLGFFNQNNAFTKPFNPDLIRKIHLDQQWNRPIFFR